jgi:hypothetical protein
MSDADAMASLRAILRKHELNVEHLRRVQADYEDITYVEGIIEGIEIAIAELGT